MHKLLILFKCSRFNKLSDLTRLYCNDFENVDSYFVICKENTEKEIKIENNNIIVNCKPDNWDSLLIRTIKCFHYFRESEYTHVMVTNVSTFVNIPVLYKRLNYDNCLSCIGYNYNFKGTVYNFPSGAGYIFKIDLVKEISDFFIKNCYIVDNKLSEHFKQNFPSTDDIFFGFYLIKKNKEINTLDRITINSENYKIKNFNCSHYRIKTSKKEKDYELHLELYNKCYLKK